MATETIRNGQSIRLNVLPGESVAVVAVTGTYNASIVQGEGVGVIATNATVATYGPYANGIVILLTASAASEIDFDIGVTPVIASDTTFAASRLDTTKLLELYGDDEMIVGTFAQRPAASAVSSGKEFLATDLGRARWAAVNGAWVLMTPCDAYKTAIAQSITDSAGQGTTETNFASLTIPALAVGDADGIELDLIWSCTNTSAAKRIRARFGGSVLFNLDLTTHLTYRQNFKLLNRGSVASQIAQANSSTIFGPIGSVGSQAFTVDFSVAHVLTITGQFPVAGTSANTLALEQCNVRFI